MIAEQVPDPKTARGAPAEEWSAGESVDHGDVGLDLNGLAVEDGGVVAPVADSIECGTNQERVAGDHFERLNGAVSSDDGAEFHAALAAELPRQRRIDRLDAME